MSSARPTLVYDVAFEEARERRASDRRSTDRRAPGMKLDPLFAATLVNHVTRPDRVTHNGYRSAQRARAGIAFDLRA